MLNQFLLDIKSSYVAKDYAFIMLILSLALLPFSINFSTFTVIVALSLKLLQVLFLKQPIFKTQVLKYSSLIGFVFFVYLVLDFVFQNNINAFFLVFEKQFSSWTLLFLIPPLFGYSKNNKKLIISFFVGVFFTGLFVFVRSIMAQISFNSEAFLKFVDIHQTYFALFILFFVNYFLGILKSKRATATLGKAGILFLLAVLFGILFILKSKVSILVFCVLLVYHLLPIISKKNSMYFLILAFILTSSIVVFNKKLNVSYQAALDFRTQIWEQSINLIKDRPLFGNQTAQEKDLLNYQHYVSGKYYLMDSDLNSHNQYLSMFIKYGLVGVLIFCGFGILILKSMIGTKSKAEARLAIGFCIILSIVFYVENVLDRHHGIVFFAVFYNYFLVAVHEKD